MDAEQVTTGVVDVAGNVRIESIKEIIKYLIKKQRKCEKEKKGDICESCGSTLSQLEEVEVEELDEKINEMHEEIDNLMLEWAAILKRSISNEWDFDWDGHVAQLDMLKLTIDKEKNSDDGA